MKCKLLSILILALAAITANAQDDFNPTLPGEPSARYKVTVGISHPEAGTVYGAGSYSTGDEVSISKNDAWFPSYAEVFYQFKHWTLNGTVYSSESSFVYRVGTENANFVAVYDAVSADEITSRVYVRMEPADASDSHTTDGQRYFEGDYANVYCYENSFFEFLGWYDGDRLVSSDKDFNYLVGEDDVTLTAKFNYNPVIPGEPIGNQDNVANSAKGDVNNDSSVDVQDVVSCVNVVLTDSDNKKADVNKDGLIDVQDVVTLVNIILNIK
ncbi:MAG: dockerin type I repeat-containing protein [Bacteroidales bacterium]|nr:dockerin type I repeat-containing protein [Candidatus Liminaster caballi]